MKKLVLVALVVLAGYVGHAYWQRLKREVELHARVETLMATLPWNARGLNVAQQEQLATLVSGLGFRLKPGGLKFETRPSEMRPIDAPLGAKYTDHKLYFTYIRPATFLPFKEEEYVATETQLIQLPSTAPIHRAASLSGMGAISESERRRMYEQTRQTMQHVKEQEKERFKQIGKQQREMAKPIELSDKMKKKIAEEMKYRR